MDLLRLLWALGPSTIKQVRAARLRKRLDAPCATVLRLLQSTPAVLEDAREAATAPLQALDANMEAPSRQQDIDMARIDKENHSIIAEAMARGLAPPPTAVNEESGRSMVRPLLSCDSDQRNHILAPRAGRLNV